MARNISPISIARTLRQHDLFYFTPRLLADLLALDLPRVYRLIARLKADRLIVKVEKGKYLLLGLEPERALSNPLFIGSQLVTPSYVSYWSALHFYGFTEQGPLTVFVATTNKKRPVTFSPGRPDEGSFRFRFVTLRPDKFFGYRREMVGGLPVLVADEAKTIIDSLDQPRYAGGVTEVSKALPAALKVVEVSTLVEYANRMGDKTLGSRLGYLLEALGQPAQGLLRSDCPVKLDPARPSSGRPVSSAPWRVVNNVPQAELFPPGVG